MHARYSNLETAGSSAEKNHGDNDSPFSSTPPESPEILAPLLYLLSARRGVKGDAILQKEVPGKEWNMSFRGDCGFPLLSKVDSSFEYFVCGVAYTSVW